MTDPARSEWGRVDPDGTVYVRTSDGERVVGSWQADAPEEALAFFARRFDDLHTQVTLLEQRVSAGTTAPDAAVAAAEKLRETIATAAAVGDLDSLGSRLDALDGRIDELRQARKKERAEALERARVRKQAIVKAAEEISSSTDWRNGSQRLRDLLDEWKGLPRLERAADDELWHRFSAARTTFSRRRRAHFAEVESTRETARTAKEALVAEAQELSTSTDWGATSAAMRDLMTRWKRAGRAARADDDRLWAQFRAAQDAFFSARDAANAERDAEFTENLTAKEALLVEAEALLPVRDPKAARAALRAIQDRFAAIGKVPRDAVRRVEQRMRAVESAVEAANEAAWRRSNPEARARAESTVGQLRDSLASLERERDAARAAGKVSEAAAADEAIATRTAWLEQAEQTLSELTG